MSTINNNNNNNNNKTPQASPSAIKSEVINRKANNSGNKPVAVAAPSDKMSYPGGGASTAAENKKATNPMGGSAALSNEPKIAAKAVITPIGKSTEVNNRKVNDPGAKPAAIVSSCTPDKKPLPNSSSGGGGGAAAELIASAPSATPSISGKSPVPTATPQASQNTAVRSIDPAGSPILNFLTSLFDQLSDPTEVMRCFQYLLDGEWPSCIRLAESMIVDPKIPCTAQVKAFIMALALIQGEYFEEADLNFLVLKTSSWPISLLTFVKSVSKLQKAESSADVAEGQAGLRSVRQEVTIAFQSMEKTQILKMKQRLCGFFEYLGKSNIAMSMETMWKKLIDDLEKAYNEAEKRSKPQVPSPKGIPVVAFSPLPIPLMIPFCCVQLLLGLYVMTWLEFERCSSWVEAEQERAPSSMLFITTFTG